MRLRRNPLKPKQVPFDLPEDSRKIRSPVRHRTVAPLRQEKCPAAKTMGRSLGYRQVTKRSSSSSSSSTSSSLYPTWAILPTQDEESSWLLFQVLSLALLFGVGYTYSNNIQQMGHGMINHVDEMTNHLTHWLVQSLSKAVPPAPPSSKFDQIFQETMDFLQRAFDK